MSRLEKILKIAVICAFAAIIIIPLLTFHSEENRVSVLENKMAAQKPVLSDYSLTDKALIDAVDGYISDRIGMKDECVLTDIVLKHRIFNLIAVPEYVMGKDGNIFYLPDSAMQAYQGTNIPSDEELTDICKRIDRIYTAAAEKGITAVFMPIPNKERLYGEYMPDSIHIIADGSILRDTKKQLPAVSDIPVVDVEAALLAHKDDGELLYFRNTDAAHWNSYGAFIGYQALMETLSGIDPSIPYLKPGDVEIQKTEERNAMLTIQRYDIIGRAFSDMEDIVYTVCPKNGLHGVEDNSVPVGFSYADSPDKLYFHWHNDECEDGKTLLIFGDSYIYSFLMPMLSESFKDVYLLSYAYEKEILGELMELTSPDIVVFEAVERMMPSTGHLQYILANLENTFTMYREKEFLDSLPISDKEYILCFDNAEINGTGTVKVDGSEETYSFSGWAFDGTADDEPVGGCYMKAGDEIYVADRFERPDLRADEPLAGFYLHAPTAALLQAGEVTVYPLTADRGARLSPHVLKVVPAD